MEDSSFIGRIQFSTVKEKYEDTRVCGIYHNLSKAWNVPQTTAWSQFTIIMKCSRWGNVSFTVESSFNFLYWKDMVFGGRSLLVQSGINLESQSSMFFVGHLSMNTCTYQTSWALRSAIQLLSYRLFLCTIISECMKLTLLQSI